MYAIARDDAIRRALVLDLEHGALVRLVRAGKRLGHHSVQPGALELGEPLHGHLVIAGGRREMNGRIGAGQAFLESRPALLERPLGVIGVVQREQVKGNEARRRLLRQQLDAASGWVDPLLQHLKLQPVADHDDDLAVDDALLGQIRLDRLDDFREIAVIGRSLREPISTSCPSRNTMERNPSHFGS